MAPDASTSPVGHTPGDWMLSGETIYALDETGGCNRFSCQVQGGYSYHGRTIKERTPADEVAANARLIAAAPELLEAPEGMVRRHVASQQNWVQAVMDAQHSGDHELSVSLRNTALQALDHFPIEQARAAITKARGDVA